MAPWEIIDRLSKEKPSEILGALSQGDPFWIGASYAIDPFVGIIVRLPMRRDPTEYGQGLQPQIFDKLARAILDNQITGDKLVLTIEALSKSCTEPEWRLWYKPILQGELDIPVDLATFNQFCPHDHQIPPPVLNKPKPIKAMEDLPQQFFMQPDYPFERVLWFIDSNHTPIEIRCYDSKFQRVRNSSSEAAIIELAQSHPMDIVLFGYETKRGFLAEDVLTREQFTQESGINPLHHRLMGLAKLNVQTVQMSPLLTPKNLARFFDEFDLMLQQGYRGMILRDLAARYPFRGPCDIAVCPTVKSVATCLQVIPHEGVRVETKRGKSNSKGIVRLGLTDAGLRDISESPVGRKLDILSCGQKDGELLLPVFQRWR